MKSREFLKNKVVVKALKIAVTAALFYLIYEAVEWSTVSEMLLDIDLGVFAAAVAVFFLRNFFGALRLKILLKSKSYDVPVFYLYKDYFIGTLFNFYLPSAVGGDVVRGINLSGYGVDKMNVVSSILIERILGVLSLLLIPLISFGLEPETTDSLVVRPYLFFSVPLLLLFGALYSDSVSNFLLGYLTKVRFRLFKIGVDLLRSIRAYKRPGLNFVQGGVLSLVFQLSGIAATYLIAVSLGSKVGFVYFIGFLPIVWLISMIPISINGLGLREQSFIVLFGLAGMNAEMAVSISILFLFQMVLQALAGGGFFVAIKNRPLTVRSKAGPELETNTGGADQTENQKGERV